MKITYSTKEESNRMQRENFLRLSCIERFYSFLDLMNSVKQYPVRVKIEKKNNFLIEIKDDQRMEK